MMGPGEKRPLKFVKDEIGDSLDVLICSASFENRCLSIPLRVGQDAIQHAVVFENTDIHEVRGNSQRLHNHFGPRARPVHGKTSEPITSVDAMHKCLSLILSPDQLNRVGVDITTFTHEQLLMLLALLRQIGCRTVLCLYSGARAYMTGNPQWLSEGIAETRSVLGFPGDLGVRTGLKLIMLVGFEWERARRIIDAYDPTHLALGLGRRVDAIEEAHYRTNEKFFNKLVGYYPDATHFQFSCNDAEATAEIIGKQCAEDGFSSVVAPLNTKVSTVGAALAAFSDSRIQLCYAQAAVYNCVSYSKPGKFFRAFRINLDP